MAQSLPHPKSYTAYGFTERAGKLQKLTIPWKDPAQGEIIVKVLACGVCGSDDQVPNGILPMQYPRIPGHEIVGDVVAIPASEKTWKLGQRVGGGWHGASCNMCNRCRVGDFVTCSSASYNGIFRDGGYAEYVLLRTEAVIHVSEDLDPAEAAPILCAGVTVFNALRNSDVHPPEIVAVQGIGGLGHLALQIAKAMGFRVVALSSGPSKESLALQLGAEAYIDGSKVDQAQALQQLGGAKVILATAPNGDAIQKLLPALATNGTICIIALALDPMTIVPVSLVTQRLTIRGWSVGTPAECEETLQLSKSHGLKSFVQRFPLEKAQEAFDHRTTARFRAVIVPGLKA